MPTATLVVLSNPTSPDVEDEYNAWYDDTHLPDVVAVEGFVSAQRFRVLDIAAMADREPPTHRYLALYEVEGDDIEVIAEAMMRRAGTDAMVLSSHLDVDGAKAFFVEPVGRPITNS